VRGSSLLSAAEAEHVCRAPHTLKAERVRDTGVMYGQAWPCKRKSGRVARVGSVRRCVPGACFSWCSRAPQESGYGAEITVPPTVMLACYDGQGTFYKPHMDSATTDPRRVTAILYLVPEGWNGHAERDGGNLVWWVVDENETRVDDKKHELEPQVACPSSTPAPDFSGAACRYSAHDVS
jgi:hypothetical protein